jgi:elongation factor Ts
MAEITASMVKTLREKTDAPMMECKKALSEADGDISKAEEILRIKLGSKAGKTSSRITAEGIVSIKIQGNKAAMVEVNCETDFVAKNEEFMNFSKNLNDIIIESNSDSIEKLLEGKLGDLTVESFRKSLIGKIGENISIRRTTFKQSKGSFYSYSHGNKIGVLVDLSVSNEILGKDIAMHIAAMKPKAIRSSDVDPKLIEVEKRVAAEKASEAGKPPEITKKMVEGAVNKFLKEVSLYGQVFVKSENNKTTIEQLLNKNQAEVNSFTIFIVGEGLEKKAENFAEEVAATTAAAKVH